MKLRLAPRQPFLNTFLIDFQIPYKRSGLLVATTRHTLPWDNSRTTGKYDMKKNVL